MHLSNRIFLCKNVIISASRCLSEFCDSIVSVSKNLSRLITIWNMFSRLATATIVCLYIASLLFNRIDIFESTNHDRIVSNSKKIILDHHSS